MWSIFPQRYTHSNEKHTQATSNFSRFRCIYNITRARDVISPRRNKARGERERERESERERERERDSQWKQFYIVVAKESPQSYYLMCAPRIYMSSKNCEYVCEHNVITHFAGFYWQFQANTQDIPKKINQTNLNPRQISIAAANIEQTARLLSRARLSNEYQWPPIPRA